MGKSNFLLCAGILLVVPLATAETSMVQQTSDALIVDNRIFTVSIERSTGKIKHAYLKQDQSGLDLVTDYPSYALFYPEFTIMHTDSIAEGYYPDWAGSVSITQAVDSSNIAVIQVLWRTDWADISWEYRFVRGTPYFTVYTERMVRQSAIFTNAQQVVMVTPEMDDSYVVNYEGQWTPTMINREFPLLGDLVNSEYSMFTAIDNGVGSRYPAAAWHNDRKDITVGILVTSVTPNQRETISYLGGGRSIRALGGFGEFQFNYFGKSDSESLLLRQGTTYGMEIYYYIDRGSADRFDTFNRRLFNERHYDIEKSENYAVASRGGRRESHPLTSWNYPQATGIYFNTQELGRHKAISIPRSQNGTRYPQIVDLSVRTQSDATGEVVDLTPIIPEQITHRSSATVMEGNRMAGEMAWGVGGLDNTLRYVVFDDSDKLTVEGQIEVTTAVTMKDLWVDLDYSPRVTEVTLLDDGKGWDIRCADPIYGTIGLAIYGTEGINEVANTGGALRLFLVRSRQPAVFQKTTVWSYRFLLYPHLGTEIVSVDEITLLHDAAERVYREYYKTLPGLEDHPEFGMRSAREAIACAAVLYPDDETTIRIDLVTDSGHYPLKFFLEGMVVDRLRHNGQPLPSATWSFNKANSILTIEADWNTGTSEIDITTLPTTVITAVEEEKKDKESASEGIVQNQPNPFNGETTISYAIPQIPDDEIVRLTIYDLTGRRIRRLVERRQTPGNSCVVWDGRDDAGYQAGTGIYLYKLEVNERIIATRKMMLVR